MEEQYMRSVSILAAAAALIAASAFAADLTPTAPHNPAVKTTEGNNPGAPVAGANSFTQGEARSRITKSGFSKVSALKKDKSGIWHGKAVKDGKAVDVSLDYEGNVVTQ
jgi:opacity protein-like surface antigen